MLTNTRNLTPVFAKILTPDKFRGKRHMATPVPSISMLRRCAPDRFTESVIFSHEETLATLLLKRNIEIGGRRGRFTSDLVGRHFFANTGSPKRGLGYAAGIGFRQISDHHQEPLRPGGGGDASPQIWSGVVFRQHIPKRLCLRRMPCASSSE